MRGKMLHQRCNALENKNQRRELKIGQTHIIPWTRFANIAQRFGSLRSPTQWLLLTTDLTQRFGSLRSPPASFARIANIAQRFGSLRSSQSANCAWQLMLTDSALQILSQTSTRNFTILIACTPKQIEPRRIQFM